MSNIYILFYINLVCSSRTEDIFFTKLKINNSLVKSKIIELVINNKQMIQQIKILLDRIEIGDKCNEHGRKGMSNNFKCGNKVQ